MPMYFAEATLVSNPTSPIEIGYYELVLYGVAVKVVLLYSGLFQTVEQFLSMFSNCEKQLFASSCLFVCLSVSIYMEQLSSHLTDFDEI